ncbi:MAG: hypothetical protein IJV71_09545 [Lachnospiraceae bacterium]|nr:hypothetical protein [Lachnospiraceae bacterium]
MKNKLKFTFLGLSILSLIGTIVVTVMFFVHQAKVDGIEFIEIANQSIMQAKEMLDKSAQLGLFIIVLAIVTGALVLATVLMFILAGRDRKKQLAGAQVTKEVLSNESN